jgi:hypothetical protein
MFALFRPNIPKSLRANSRKLPFFGDSPRRPKNKTTACYAAVRFNFEIAQNSVRGENLLASDCCTRCRGINRRYIAAVAIIVLFAILISGAWLLIIGVYGKPN